jgi:hypothetical protein
VRLVRRAVKGSRFVLTVGVPAAGRITIAGADVETLRRWVARAGSYSLTLTLTGEARRGLKRRRKLRVAVRVSYAPRAGTASSASVAFTVKR